jgi:N-methylhydantoinase A
VKSGSVSTTRYKLGIDVGGTFTDFILVDAEGRIVEAKVPSTPGEPAGGIGDGLADLASAVGATVEGLLGRIDLVVHGSTVALNALIEGKGAKTGLLCTAGFRDSIEIRLAWKEKRYDWTYPPPPVLVPRDRRLPVRERVTKEGVVHTPLVEEDVDRAIAEFRRLGVESVAVCFLWSFRNPAHERRVGEILAERFPEAYGSLSVEVLPEIREFDRTSTTVVNAYVGPVMKRYVQGIESYLRRLGYAGPVRYMQSNSGIASGHEVVRRAVYALGSGPAAAPAAGLFHSRQFGEENILTVDMGGTSCDVCLVRDGKPDVVKGVDVHRYRLGVPMIDVNAVGAGGGSIAQVDAGGILQVGPQSAGATPGPACYGRGGTEATVTDANVVLGYLDASRTLGGRIALRKDFAERAIGERVASKLGIGLEEAAMAVFKIVNNNMARAISEISVERGYDPRDFGLYVAGGCGPIHAWRLAQEIGVDRVLVPKVAPNFCAFGEVVADVRHDYTSTHPARLDQVDPAALCRLFAEMEEEGAEALRAEGLDPARLEVVRQFVFRYVGQIYECSVTVPRFDLSRERLAEVGEAFHRVHEGLYGYAERDNLCELINVGVSVHGALPRIRFADEPSDGLPVEAARTGTRRIFLEKRGGFLEVPVYAGERLRSGHNVAGPAVVEEPGTTIVVFPETRLELDRRTYQLAAE